MVGHIISLSLLWYLRKCGTQVDSLTVKCGYGPQLKSAMLKIQSYTQKGAFTEKNNIAEKLLAIVNKIYYIVGLIYQKIGLSSSYSIDRRVQDIDIAMGQTPAKKPTTLYSFVSSIVGL